MQWLQRKMSIRADERKGTLVIQADNFAPFLAHCLQGQVGKVQEWLELSDEKAARQTQGYRIINPQCEVRGEGVHQYDVETGYGPLHCAVIGATLYGSTVPANTHFMVLQMLLNDGRFDIDAKDNLGGFTALMYASGKHLNESSSLALLNAGADCNLGNDFGVTALHSAAIVGSVSLCKAMLKRGGNPLAETLDGVTPIDVAANDETLEILARGAEVRELSPSHWGLYALFKLVDEKRVSGIASTDRAANIIQALTRTKQTIQKTALTFLDPTPLL